MTEALLKQTEVNFDKNSYDAHLFEATEITPSMLTKMPEHLLLLRMTQEDFGNLKDEVKIFFDKKKDRKFAIFPSHSSLIQLAYELQHKVIPIIEFIELRNYYPRLIYKLRAALELIDGPTLSHLTLMLNAENTYGKDLVEHKLERLIAKKENLVRALVILLFSAQPSKDRPISPNVVGISAEEFANIEDE